MTRARAVQVSSTRTATEGDWYSPFLQEICQAGGQCTGITDRKDLAHLQMMMEMSVKPQTPVVNANEVSRSSTGSVIKGEISSPNDIRIDGTFEGRIFCSGRVVAGEKAEIKGDIVCENVDFWGKLEGSLYVKDTLALKDTCSVNGDLHIKRLVVELGAHFNGTCKMLSEGEFEKVAGAVTGQKPAQQPKPVVQPKPAAASQTSAPAVS